MGNIFCSSCSCSSSPSHEDYQNFISKFDAVKEMSHVDNLISHIDELLNAIDEGRQVPNTAQVGSINSAGDLLEKILKRSAHICKRDIMPKLDRETRKFIIDITNQAAKIQWLGVAFSVVGFVLERIEQVYSNKSECIDLLKYMCNLAKYIKHLDEHLAQEKVNRVFEFIVKGCLMCISQMKSNALSKFFAAPVAAENLRKFQAELGHEYQELSLEAIIVVLNRIPVVLPPSQGISPQAVGIEEATNHVIGLLNMKGGSVRAVVIYGQGGIGKTTLATAVFSKLDLTNYKHCRVVMEQNCSEADLKSLQHQILRDLFRHNIDLRNLIEGREELSKEFKKTPSQPVFIFVDNVLKESDLEKLLPIADLASLPAQSRILLTTRNLNETRVIVQAGIERHSYKVASLRLEDAQKLLSMFALGSEQGSFDPDIDITGLLEICQGIPLVLQLAGRGLCEHAQNMQECKNAVEHLKTQLLQGEEDDLSERMVDFVYHRLNVSCKEAFLDIVFFFCNWERSRVAFGVGEMEFQELERSALVNVTDEGEVNLHDIVKARGRMLSLEGERITDLESLTDVLQDAQRIKKTKGIFLSENFELEARHLNLMKRSLRVLILTESTRIVNGECEGAFEHLRLLCIHNHDNYSRMNVSKHPKLTALLVRHDVEPNFPEVSGVTSSLKYMCIESSTLVNLATTLSQLQSLRSLTLQNCRGFDSLPQNIGNLPFLGKLDLSSCSSLTSLSDNFDSLSSLENLDLTYCPSLISLPDSFGNLSSLNQLDLPFCSSLISLPDSFGNLSSLNQLYLQSCSSLISLPDSFGNLSSLNQLDLRSCYSLISLPDSFGNLSSLNQLDLSSCSSLISLPDSFGNLSSLNQLDLESCSSLISLPDSFGSLSDLVELRLDYCTELSVLPESFGNLGSLEKLILTDCEKLSNLPQNFGQLKCLKYVSIYGCEKLQTLSSDFECLSSLVAINASRCLQLEQNAMDKLAMMKGLMFVVIDGSPKLKIRWDQVKDQYSLVERQGSWLGADRDVIMHRAFFHSESKFLHVDENGQFAESPRPAAGVILCLLLTVCDLTSPSNSRYLEAVKRKWMEVRNASVEMMMMMILVEVGSSWEESEGRVTESLPHLPRGTTAWIAPDNRARLLFVYSLLEALQDEYNNNKMCDVIVSMLTSVDEEGRMKMQLLNHHYTPDFEYQDSWEKIFSPISEASKIWFD